MNWNFMFFANSILLGFGLAMDAFSVSVANGLNEPKIKRIKMLGISGTFAVFQFLMPMIGWICVRTVVQYFEAFEKFIPYIALVLLLYIGGKMIYESVKCRSDSDKEKKKVGIGALFIQGVATSIDALSVGFTIEDYGFVMAFVSALIIGVITFAVCYAGLVIGKVFGDRFSNKAEIVGGIILIGIGIEIFLKGVLDF